MIKVVAPIEAINADITPIKFKFSKEGPKAKNSPKKAIKKVNTEVYFFFIK